MKSEYKMKISRNYYKEIDCHKKYGGNSNMIVIGSSGSGKTENVVMPLLADDFSKEPVSFVVQDCKGQLYKRLKSKFIQEGYIVKNIDFTNPSISNCFNPFAYVNNMEDARKIVKILVSSQMHFRNDPFWEVESIELISASMMFLKNNFMERDRNFYHLYNFLEIFASDYNTVNFGDDGVRDMRDVFFAECDEDVPENIRKQNVPVIYDMFYSKLKKLRLTNNPEYANILLGYYKYPDKTFFSIYATARSALAIFASAKLKKIMNRKSDINFKEIATNKSIIFINPSDTSRVYDPVVNVFYTLCLQNFIKIADNTPEGRLNIPFRFILDDFASGTTIQDFDKIISNIRSRNISCTLLMQSISQLESLYSEAISKTILANCSTLLYLGSNDYEQELYIAKRMNKPYEYIHLMDRSSIIIFDEHKEPIIDQKNDYVLLNAIQAKSKSNNEMEVIRND